MSLAANPSPASPERRLARRAGRWLLVLALSGALAAAAESPVGEPAVATETSSAIASGPRVVDVYAEGRRGDRGKFLPLAAHLVVEVDGLAEWLGSSGSRCYDLRLYLDGQSLELAPERCLLGQQEVWFQPRHIDRAEDPAWQALLAEREGLTARVDVTVGLADDEPLPTEVLGSNDRRIELVASPILIAASSILLVAFLFFWWLAARTPMLRRAVPGTTPADSTRAPFSLARVQVAWWFFLVLGSFLFLSALAGDIATVPTSVLGLMGIAAGTYLGAEVIDTNREQRSRRERSEHGASSGEPPPEPRAATSRGWLVDILSDPSGIAFHRFQIFVWTIVLGILFVTNVWRTLAMPDVPSGLLGLMGISGGTYLGIKLPEAGGER